MLTLLAALLCLAQVSDFDLGVALFEKGRFEEAIPPLTRAVQAAPEDARAWRALGVVYAAMEDYLAAEAALRRACELDPKLESACYYLGRALYSANKFEPALEVLNKALATDRQPWRVHLALAQALEALGRASEAEPRFRQALELCRECSERPGVAYGVFLFRQGRLGEAAAPLRRAVQQFPNSPSAHLELGRVLYQQERLEAAIAHLEKAATLDPKSTQARLLLDKARRLQGSRTVK